MSRRPILAVGAALVLLLFGDQLSVADNPEPPEGVSLLQLIATPRAYHDKLVRVIGFAFLEFEGHELYLHKEDFEHSLLKNSVWVATPYPIPDAYKRLNGEYVVVEGRFNADRKGHMDMCSGELAQISRYDRWPTRAELEGQLRPPK